MGIVDRIQMKTKEKGTNIKTLEKEIGIGNGTIRRWDERSPQCDKISLVANYLQVSLDWLIFGKENDNLTPEEKQILEAYRHAEPDMRKAARKMLDVKELPEKLLISKNGKNVI